MGVVVAGGEVGAGEAAEAELAAVGAAAHGDAGHLLANGGIGRAGVVDEVGVLGTGHHVGKVVVLVVDVDGHVLLAHLDVDELGGVTHHALALLDLGLVVVADDVVGAGGLAVSAHALQVEEAVIALGELRALLGGKHLVEAHDELGGIDHHALGGAGVAGEAAGMHVDLGGVEGLVAELAQGATVDGVAKVRAKLLEVQQGCAVADLLVRHEGERQARVGQAGVGLQAGKQAHDHGVAGLVVPAQQGGSVRGHDVPTGHVGQLWIGLGRNHDLAAVTVGANAELSALVVLDLGVHGAAHALPGGVDVAAEAQARQVLAALGGRPVRRHVGVLVDGDVLCAQLAQVLRNDVGNVELLRRGGYLLRRQRIRLRRNRAILNKPIKHVRHVLLLLFL